MNNTPQTWPQALTQDKPNSPRHVAIIMDGNGRWAKSKKKPRTFGHRQAEKAIRCTVNYCLKHKVDTLTFFVFSTENWNRPAEEVQFIMRLLEEFLRKSEKLLHENRIKLTWLGQQNNVPEKIKILFNKLVSDTTNYSNMNLCLAVDYGARKEIIGAIKKLLHKVMDQQLAIDQINEANFEQELYTKNLTSPDLIIRTSGEYRLSNFLLWQASYSELFFCDTLWPDFSEKDLDLAFQSYFARNRRWGNIH